MNRRAWSTRILVAAVLATTSAGLPAREPVQAPNPYQGEMSFDPGQSLDPAVMIAGVDWFQLKLDILDELESGTNARTEVSLGFRNTSADDVEVLVILLFQGSEGEALERVTLEPMRVRDGRERTETDRYRIPSEALQQARTLYVFCEVEQE